MQDISMAELDMTRAQQRVDLSNLPLHLTFCSPSEQIERLHQIPLFQGLNSDFVDELADMWPSTLPAGIAVIPKPHNFGGVHRALEYIHDEIDCSQTYELHSGFTNLCYQHTTTAQVRPTKKTLAWYEALDEQPGDFWVFPCTFGNQQKGKTIVSLTPYELGVLLATHPTWLFCADDILYCDGWKCQIHKEGEPLSFYYKRLPEQCGRNIAFGLCLPDQILEARNVCAVT